MTRQWPHHTRRHWEDDGKHYVQLDSRLPCGCVFGAFANDRYLSVADQKAIRKLNDAKAATDMQCLATGKHRRK